MNAQPSGSELRVNGYVTDNRDSSAIAISSRGDFAIAWQSQGQGRRVDVYGRPNRANGASIRPELRVNRQAASNPATPAVAMDGAGNFVVVWMANRANGTEKDVVAQRFDAAGNRKGAQFRINTSPGGDQALPAVAMDFNGNFVVTWTSSSPLNPNTQGKDRNGTGVYARRFNRNGSPVGREFLVNTFTAGNQSNSAVAMNATGEYVITWESGRQDGDGKGVFVQRYSRNGRRINAELLANTTTANDQDQPTVGIDAAGNFGVAWESQDQDGSGAGIYGRRFNTNGNSQGREFRINTTTRGDQITPALGMDAEGYFTVTWASRSQDNDGFGIAAQQFNSNGRVAGRELRVNRTQAGNQINPAIATALNGDFVISWTSAGKNIFAQRYSNGSEFPSSAIRGDQRNNRLRGTADADEIYGFAGNDVLKGVGGNDLLFGGLDNDTLYGNAGQDALFGEAGRDLLSGGGGDDFLAGQEGRDTLIGGGGSDIFVIGLASGQDRIRDFQDGIDRLQWNNGLRFRDLTMTQVGANTFVSVGSATIGVLQGISASQITLADFVNLQA